MAESRMVFARHAGKAVTFVTVSVAALFKESSIAQSSLPVSAAGGDSLNAVPAQSQVTFEDKATGDWWGARERLKNRGVSFDAGLVLEGFKNFRGGLQTSDYIGASTFDLSLSLDTEKSLHWHGGKFYVDLVDHAGQDPSVLLVGDLQVLTSSTRPRTYRCLSCSTSSAWQFTKWAKLMPDLQYISHPGGQYPDALVGTLRLMVQF